MGPRPLKKSRWLAPVNIALRYWFLGLLLFAVADPASAGGPFEPNQFEGNLASVIRVPEDSTGSENTRLVASGLAVVLGPFGAHRLYLGTSAKVAVAYGLTFGGFYVLALIDLGHILFTKDLDRFRNNDRVFMWTREQAPTPP